MNMKIHVNKSKSLDRHQSRSRLWKIVSFDKYVNLIKYNECYKLYVHCC